MKGNVDEGNRALITIAVCSRRDGDCENVVAWIDTAFDGHLVFPAQLIEELGLESLVDTEAILADGSQVALETYICFLDWFGKRFPVQVIANEGRFPLLGTELLAGHELRISYVTNEISID